ncbi:hypothetical protein VB834_02740 [Limnoraphis robusta Tam1]|uniref:Uncharacterized protein n=1 Tax=Limnoraphis robusta CCNP1315 TaxID=3110306 RepID=A0ABU5U1V0_9CYAN|nr:hypothetical protein [Limnoraphis robusta]MEA5500915.1 hypothetical protein [Limnoraphis robusta BA-68 BA1]MEA5521176.1 hypothetical protein [Limnoraphis robusta CCNP1315]MEA5537943.1 hypothetical protein [Limnoraphis robusta Tam1]MEA5546674.1 hypothetical protein [Limnoraphis robusta CCNP1324]
MVSEIIVTPEQIAFYRKQLAGNEEALAALDVIEEWDGDLADAAESIAKRNGIEGVETNADLRWFSQKLKECHQFICQPKYENLRDKYVSTLIPVLTEFLAGSLGCPPGVAGLIATPFALYIGEEKMDKFCRSFNGQP